MRGKVLLVLVLCSIVLAQNPNNDNAQQKRFWSGLWQDACPDDLCFGGQMSLCVVGDEVFGRYSDIGFLHGHIIDTHVKGEWYEAGYSQTSSGGFEWYPVDNTVDIFSGSWWFNHRKCERYGWSSFRIDRNEPSDTECGVLPSSRES
jgi:hypothetical protein